MIGRDFPEQNCELGPPKGMSVDEVRTLPVWRDGREVVSCWQPSEEERQAIANGGPVWVRVMGTSMPPISVVGLSPFEEASDG